MAYKKRFSHRWSRILAGLDVWPAEAIQSDGDRLRIVGVEAAIESETDITRLVLSQSRIVSDLAVRAGAVFDWSGDSLIARFEDLKCEIRNRADLMVAHEIFGQRIYDGDFPECDAVVDVGANIGLSSLAFAHALKKPIHAYELSETTYKQANRNVALNAAMSDLIHIHPYGWSDCDGEVDIVVNPEMHASHSLVQPSHWQGETERVRFRKASSVLDEITNQHGTTNILLKLDVEGAEYEILRTLSEAGLLRNCRVLIIEWHRVEGHDPEEIREILRKDGYHWFEDRHALVDVGMIRAIRK